MPTGLTPQVVDIPLLLPNQTPPKHAGPIGRLTSMVDAQIKHFLPSSQQQPQRITVEPRDGFTALTAACRDSATGAVVASPDWNNPELLAPLGNQLLSICDSVPRVNNGSAWTYYGNQRVVTNQLREDIFHTTNHTLQAPDNAYLNGVTCSVWTEASTAGPFTVSTAMVGFRADDGAWVRSPGGLFSTTSGTALARVVQDGTYFWVAFTVGTHIVVNVYDTNGALIASDSTTIPQVWTPMPGYWDIAAFNNGGSHYVLIAQPDAFTTSNSNVDMRLHKCTIAGSVITIVNTAPGITSDCSGPIAFADSTATGVPTIITAASANFLWMTELSHAFAQTHAYAFGAVLAGSGIPDSLTGWMEANGAGAIAHVAYSLLSNFSPASGQPNDPGLRYTRSYACTRAGVVTLTNQVNGVLLSSRAFQIDNDWYAATYYQSGGGSASTTAIPITPSNPNDYFTGDVTQPVTVHDNDFATGAGSVPIGDGWAFPTQSIGVIPHTAGDQITAPGSINFLAGLFNGTGTSAFNLPIGANSAAGSILHISGAANAQNNGDWWVTGVVSNSTVNTELVSLQGNAMVIEAFGPGVTASLTQVWAIEVPQNAGIPYGGNTLYPPSGVANRFSGGTATVSGATGANAPLNGSYSIFRIYYNANWWTSFAPTGVTGTVFLMTKTSGAAGLAGAYYVFGPTVASSSVTVAPALANAWGLTGLQSEHDTRTGIDMDLLVSGAHQGGNNGLFLETANPMPSGPYGLFVDVTGSQPLQRAEVFTAAAGLPTIARVMVDPSKAFQFHLNNANFDLTYIGATLVISGISTHPEDNGAYRIGTVVDSKTVIVSALNGQTGTTLYNLTGSETITVTKDASVGQPAFQPCWFLTPLSVAQKVAGRWEWAIAYADWRNDGATKANQGTFERNGFPLALSSVAVTASGKQMALPFRAQSFTAGQTVKSASGGIIGIQSTAESTVGLKLFTLSSAAGQASSNSGELFLPGPQASELTASGFTEQGVNLGPEKPFLAQSHAAINLGLTQQATYQYVVVFELMSENGDRIWSVTSPPADIAMTGNNNTVTLGGRMPGPTLRPVGISIYRTANTGSPPVATIQHYKITNDLDVNGAGFTFTSVNGGADADTWSFVDQVPDSSILDSETLLTDQGFLQRFPAPAHSQSVGSWQNRSWFVGYDGAIWMSGEKTEGDAVWCHPAFRYTLPTDDKPVALAAMENYLLVFCSRSIWFIPAVQFPDNTGANGELPTPQPLPFRNGCTGFAVTMKDGVAYSSTAGGVWLINRSLQNLYLSQPMQDDLGSATINGMTIDGLQRLIVSTRSNVLFAFDQLSQAWLKWQIGTFGTIVSALTTWQSNVVYQDAARVRQLVPGTFADVLDGVSTGVAPTITLAIVSLGAVKALKRVWAINITGDELGPCNLHAQLQYPDELSAFNTNFGPFALASGPLNVEINPLIEETTSFVLKLFADFSGVPTPGASYSLELVTADCGVEETLSKVPNAQRLTGS